MNPMFCFQCEQTAGGKGCQFQKGVCGKEAPTARAQDRLTGAMIALAKALPPEKRTPETDALLRDGLFTTVTNVNFSEAAVTALAENVEAALKALPGAPAPFNMDAVWQAQEDVRSLKSLILFGLRGTAAYAHHAAVLGHQDPALNAFFYTALAALAETGDPATLLPLVLETGRMNLTCMALLDTANTSAYGHPEPTPVSLTIEKGPFIIVTGHDLHDLKLLLDQTQGKGVGIYTHGEMLPAHAYPAFKKYPHFKGHFGTAWQNQQTEFAAVPAPILYTTNCIMPVKESYADRVFTTSVVAFPGTAHIGEDKDFTPVIAKALALGGYPKATTIPGINGGTTLTTGFAHDAVMKVAGPLIDTIKAGKIRHIFLVGGCDGAKPGRNYYTEFVKQTPPDTLVLTLACGKFRFNDLDLGTINGIPRLLDVGQCNDAYSAIQIALALAEAFKCGVNDLPLSLILSWYEQKAVCILLTLLALGIKNIRLGPSLPAFVSPAILDTLVKTYGIKPITTPEEDLRAILG